MSAADLERACRFVLNREDDDGGAGRIIHRVSSDERPYAREDVVIVLDDLLSSVEAGIGRYESELKANRDRAMAAGTSPVSRWWDQYYGHVE